MSQLEPLYTSDQIQWRIGELADEIHKTYGDEPILLIAILKGSLYFVADLSRRLGENVEIDFVQVSSYGDQKSSTGVVKIKKDLDINIEDRNVLLVEDIVDSGLTLKHLRELLAVRHPKSLRVVSLLSKPEARLHHVPLEFVGFEISDEFVVGYGLDYAERYRNLPFIAILDD
jgi:hypoxanthine phosphoribosyltransferase